ncbi:DoxX family protein [Leptospira gomenensis]|uniref:DoxX family protein n=1 Tax=Leptospira gomenensis TaxID=2484974 RepID=A0A5F1Z391_9LEPT|nr:DoxX family protein [Leptospira gomenensis]TGK33411.1 DoxX family protein [Leptospira gomenensis]TGK40932.1 DoxX family protein [Leptospira gomenensis]TGK46397.1 DoxX family protein [Leptospira gomenensis]TGK67467.1 DoxX family protein [Leptospira gomenensis]
MIQNFFSTKESLSPLFLRIGLSICIFPHGAQKALGWFGGVGWEAAMDFFVNTAEFPAFLAVLAIVSEFFGSIALALGLFTRLAAFGITCTLAVAGWTHREIGFFMNWFGNQGGEGFEYHILAVSMGISLVLLGGGSYSLDSWISDRIE